MVMVIMHHDDNAIIIMLVMRLETFGSLPMHTNQIRCRCHLINDHGGLYRGARESQILPKKARMGERKKAAVAIIRRICREGFRKADIAAIYISV